MHKFLRTMTAAAVAAAMAPAFAADATYNVDVVVVGAGAAGTAAGWAAAEKGLKVVTLEKQAMVGGTGKFSEGIFAVESSMQRNWNYGLTKDEAFQKIMNYGHWRGNAKMVRAFVDKSGETIDWSHVHDRYPDWIFDDAKGRAPFTKGTIRMEHDDIEKSFDLFFELMDFDVKTGAPTEKCLNEYGLAKAVPVMKKEGLL